MARSGSGSYTRNVLGNERPILNAPPRREFLGSASNTLGVYGYGSTTQSFQPRSYSAGYNGEFFFYFCRTVVISRCH